MRRGGLCFLGCASNALPWLLKSCTCLCLIPSPTHSLPLSPLEPMLGVANPCLLALHHPQHVWFLSFRARPRDWNAFATVFRGYKCAVLLASHSSVLCVRAYLLQDDKRGHRVLQGSVRSLWCAGRHILECLLRQLKLSPHLCGPHLCLHRQSINSDGRALGHGDGLAADTRLAGYDSDDGAAGKDGAPHRGGWSCIYPLLHQHFKLVININLLFWRWVSASIHAVFQNSIAY